MTSLPGSRSAETTGIATSAAMMTAPAAVKGRKIELRRNRVAPVAMVCVMAVIRISSDGVTPKSSCRCCLGDHVAASRAGAKTWP